MNTARIPFMLFLGVLGATYVVLADSPGEYELLSGGVGIAGESSGGDYTQTGSVVLTTVDANELSGGDYTMVEESVAQVDCIVGMNHFLRFAEHWLRTDCSELNNWCDGADLDNLGSVDFLDLELFVYDWLYYCPLDWPLR